MLTSKNTPSFNEAYLPSLADLFAPSLLRKLADDKGLDRLLSFFHEADFSTAGQGSIKLSRILDRIYEVLVERYRCEYVYKNTLARRLVLERHEVGSTMVFTEFWAQQSKADVVLVNGTTVAYEIKTELDSLRRLKSQIESYARVFDKVFVVTHPAISSKVRDFLSINIGILELSNDLTFSEIRCAQSDLSRIDPESVFDSMRKEEYRRAIEREIGYCPTVPNTAEYSKCKALFRHIPLERVHSYFVDALKQRRQQHLREIELHRLPISLAFPFLANSVSSEKFHRILATLNSPIYLT